MKKYVLLISIVSIFAFILLIYVDNNDKLVLKNDSNKQIVNSNAITMMYETDVGSGEYQVSSDNAWPQNGYVFNETLSDCENGSKLTWDEENKAIKLNVGISDKCYVYFDIYKPTLADYIKNLYTADGENDIYLHDGSGTYGNLEAGDNSYRYSGDDPNNYVCFGSSLESCPYDNLYRVIGVFDNKVKLIKYDYLNYSILGLESVSDVSTASEFSPYYKGSLNTVSTYNWSAVNNNSWSDSSLQVALNNNYLNNLGSEWSNKISEVNWYTGGVSYDIVYQGVVNSIYSYELGANKVDEAFNSKIGLMYVSEYGYAASPENWNTTMQNMNNDNNRNNNWLYMGGYEWLLTVYPEESNYAFFISKAGAVGGFDVGRNRAVRPTFYLKESIQYISGDGTINNPYRIK